jgi:outer membrane lipase/esterase
MIKPWMRATVLAFSSALLALLSGCGAGSIESPFVPARVFSVGDSLTYLGNSSGLGRFTVNGDATINNWAVQLANRFGVTLDGVAAGGRGYAQANALVSSVASQLNGVSLNSTDLVVMGAGIADITAQAIAVANGQKTVAQALIDVAAAGSAYADAARNLVNSTPVSHVLVLNAYDLSGSAFATSYTLPSYAATYSSSTARGYAGGNFAALLHDLTRKFNDALKINFGSQTTGNRVRMYDLEMLFLVANLTDALITDLSNPACVSVSGTDPSATLSSLSADLCTSATSATGVYNASTNTIRPSDATATATSTIVDFNHYLFADDRYPTPEAHRMIGNAAYNFVHVQW